MSGNTRGRKRRFGSVRQLGSGRWQARYPGPDGALRNAPDTFETRTAAENFLTGIEADMLRGTWRDPDAGKVSVEDYALKWIAQRDLSDRTRELYTGFVRNHIANRIGHLMVADVAPPRIREWRSDLIADGVGATTIAKCYRFVRAVFNTAADDELVRRNPCRIAGAGQEKAPERPVATILEVFAIAAAIEPRYRLLVLLAAFGQLRYGELVALRKTDLVLPPRRRSTPKEIEAGSDPNELIDDVGVPKLRVSQAVAQLDSGEQLLKGTKSDAGRRTVALPAAILPDIRAHLAKDGKGGFVDPEPDGRLFRGPKGATPRRQNFNAKVWKPALAAAGVNRELHLHDLRHTGATLAAQTGATLRELMARLGQSSTRAALIYQHAASERDTEIAVALDTLIQAARVATTEEDVA